MIIEDQVCSFELSNKLKELGFEQNSYFFYEYYHDNAYRLGNPSDRDKGSIEIAAFNASELMDLIPNRITLGIFPYYYFTFKLEKLLYIPDNEVIIIKDIYSSNYQVDITNAVVDRYDFPITELLFEPNIWDINLCNCLAKTLIKLCEMMKDINEKIVCGGKTS